MRRLKGGGVDNDFFFKIIENIDLHTLRLVNEVEDTTIHASERVEEVGFQISFNLPEDLKPYISTVHCQSIVCFIVVLFCSGTE